MFWAGFCEEFQTILIPLDGDPAAQRNGVSARVIYELYRDILPIIIEQGDIDIFMHDNAPVHKARIVRELLDSLRIQVMDWPPYSPDLNPIENLWSILKREIYRLHPNLEHARDTNETLRRLVAAAREAWANIRSDILVRLSETMPNRIGHVKILKSSKSKTSTAKTIIPYCFSSVRGSGPWQAPAVARVRYQPTMLKMPALLRLSKRVAHHY